MAITLDELLGRNTQSVAQQNSVERFPSYEDFKSSRGTYAQQNQAQNVRYNFDMAPAQAPRSVESVRSYEANRPYVAPQSSEYQTREYPFYDNLRASAPAQPMQYSAPVQQYEQPQYVEPVQYQAPVQTHPANVENFYEFTAHDTERLSDQELYDRLAGTAQNGPVFQDAQTMQKAHTSLFARKAQRTQDTTEERQRGRLNTKGKIILGVYLAVIALVASLIIVNATKINAGKAVTPTSKVGAVASQQANNTESFGIDSKYEVRIDK